MAVITGQGDMYDSSMGQNYCTILHTIRRDRDISLAAINLKRDFRSFDLRSMYIILTYFFCVFCSHFYSLSCTEALAISPAKVSTVLSPVMVAAIDPDTVARSSTSSSFES